MQESVHPTGSNHSLTVAYKVALCAVLILLLGSLLWYKQRMLFIDPAWIVYNIINTNDFCIAEHRYGAVATQIVPLIGAYFNWSLRTILLLYSASFYVFYLGVMLAAGRVFRQPAFGILLGLYLLLMVSDNFFWPNNEVHQGIAWMLLSLAIFFGKPRQNWLRLLSYVLFPLCAFLAIFSHFIVIVPFSFLWIYCLLNERPRFDKRRIAQVVAGSICILVLFLIKYDLGKDSWYDGSRLGAVKTLSLQAITSSFTNGHAKTMGVLFLKNYWLLILIFMAGQIFLLKAKRYLQALLAAAFTVGYCSLICLTYPDAFRMEQLYYIESQWMSLSIIVATPFVFHAIPEMRTSAAMASMVAICLIRLGYICYSYPRFNNRLSVLNALTESIHQAGITKAAITMDSRRREAVFFMDWGTPVESIMLSRLRGHAKPVTFKIVDTAFVMPQPDKDLFLNCFGNNSIRSLNARYFPIDTSSTYQTRSWSESATNH